MIEPGDSSIRIPRFWPLFAAALAVRLGVVILGSALIPVQPTGPVRVFGILVAGYPADLRPPTEDDPIVERYRETILAGPIPWIEPWYRWDGCWYVKVAEQGYSGPGDRSGRLGVAFMPMVPLVFAGTAAIGWSPFIATLLLANLAGAAGAAVFTRVAVRLTADRAVGMRTFVLLQAFPTAFFYSAPYSESFALLYTALALWAWQNSQAARASAFALLGSLSRMSGPALGVAALVGWILDDRSRAGLRRALLLAAGSFTGLILFWGYLAYAVGDPFASLKAHEAWGRHPLSPINPWRAIQSIYHPVVPHWGEAFLALGFSVLGIRAWIRRGTFWGVLTLVPIGQMLLSGTFLSGHRVLLASLPGFIELADVLKNRLAYRLTVGGFVIVQMVLLNRYVHWVFAG